MTKNANFSFLIAMIVLALPNPIWIRSSPDLQYLVYSEKGWVNRTDEYAPDFQLVPSGLSFFMNGSTLLAFDARTSDIYTFNDFSIVESTHLDVSGVRLSALFRLPSKATMIASLHADDSFSLRFYGASLPLTHLYTTVVPHLSSMTFVPCLGKLFLVILQSETILIYNVFDTSIDIYDEPPVVPESRRVTLSTVPVSIVHAITNAAEAAKPAGARLDQLLVANLCGVFSLFERFVVILCTLKDTAETAAKAIVVAPGSSKCYILDVGGCDAGRTESVVHDLASFQLSLLQDALLEHNYESFVDSRGQSSRASSARQHDSRASRSSRASSASQRQSISKVARSMGDAASEEGEKGADDKLAILLDYVSTMSLGDMAKAYNMYLSRKYSIRVVFNLLTRSGNLAEYEDIHAAPVAAKPSTAASRADARNFQPDVVVRQPEPSRAKPLSPLDQLLLQKDESRMSVRFSGDTNPQDVPRAGREQKQGSKPGFRSPKKSMLSPAQSSRKNAMESSQEVKESVRKLIGELTMSPEVDLSVKDLNQSSSSKQHTAQTSQVEGPIEGPAARKEGPSSESSSAGSVVRNDMSFWGDSSRVKPEVAKGLVGEQSGDTTPRQKLSALKVSDIMRSPLAPPKLAVDSSAKAAVVSPSISAAPAKNATAEKTAERAGAASPKALVSSSRGSHSKSAAATPAHGYDRSNAEHDSISLVRPARVSIWNDSTDTSMPHAAHAGPTPGKLAAVRAASTIRAPTMDASLLSPHDSSRTGATGTDTLKQHGVRFADAIVPDHDYHQLAARMLKTENALAELTRTTTALAAEKKQLQEEVRVLKRQAQKAPDGSSGALSQRMDTLEDELRDCLSAQKANARSMSSFAQDIRDAKAVGRDAESRICMLEESSRGVPDFKQPLEQLTHAINKHTTDISALRHTVSDLQGRLPASGSVVDTMLDAASRRLKTDMVEHIDKLMASRTRDMRGVVDRTISDVKTAHQEIREHQGQLVSIGRAVKGLQDGIITLKNTYAADAQDTKKAGKGLTAEDIERIVSEEILKHTAKASSTEPSATVQAADKAETRMADLHGALNARLDSEIDRCRKASSRELDARTEALRGEMKSAAQDAEELRGRILDLDTRGDGLAKHLREAKLEVRTLATRLNSLLDQAGPSMDAQSIDALVQSAVAQRRREMEAFLAGQLERLVASRFPAAGKNGGTLPGSMETSLVVAGGEASSGGSRGGDSGRSPAADGAAEGMPEAVSRMLASGKLLDALASRVVECVRSKDIQPLLDTARMQINGCLNDLSNRGRVLLDSVADLRATCKPAAATATATATAAAAPDLGPGLLAARDDIAEEVYQRLARRLPIDVGGEIVRLGEDGILMTSKNVEHAVLAHAHAILVSAFRRDYEDGGEVLSSIRKRVQDELLNHEQFCTLLSEKALALLVRAVADHASAGAAGAAGAAEPGDIGSLLVAALRLRLRQDAGPAPGAGLSLSVPALRGLLQAPEIRDALAQDLWPMVDEAVRSAVADAQSRADGKVAQACDRQRRGLVHLKEDIDRVAAALGDAEERLRETLHDALAGVFRRLRDAPAAPPLALLPDGAPHEAVADVHNRVVMLDSRLSETALRSTQSIASIEKDVVSLQKRFQTVMSLLDTLSSKYSGIEDDVQTLKGLARRPLAGL